MSILDELGIDPEQIDKKARIGTPEEVEVGDTTVIDLPVSYWYKDKKSTFILRIAPDRQISTVTEKTLGASGLMETEILQEGMDRDEIEEFFPPTTSKSPYDFSMKGVIRSIIFEAFMKREIDYLPEGNVRGFWYTHLIHIIESILGLGETDSVKSTINQAWEDLIVSGLVTYEGMNIRSDSESSTHSVVKDSPFSNLIVAVEKDDKFESMKWIPKLFNCTLMTAGGQPSRANARRFILDMRDDARVDLNQDFKMTTISDLDPAGYYIQESFKNQLEKAIEYYGGTGKITIYRLFVRKDQVTQTLLDHDAVPCYDKSKSPKSKKAENTKWARFCELTDGGVYKTVPRSVAISHGAIKPDEQLGESHVKVRAKLELNAFPDDIINRRVVAELLRIIKDTSDESLILIPEIMRIFEQERKKAMEEVYAREHQAQILPLIEEFLKGIDRAKTSARITTRDEVRGVETWYEETEEEVSEPFDERIGELEEEADARVPDELSERDRLENEIAELEQELEGVNDDIQEQTQDLLDLIQEQETEKEEALKPHQADRDEALEIVKARGDYRKEELEKFRREKQTLFNPMEIALKDNIEEQLAQENLKFFFDDLEGDRKTASHIAKLLMSPQRLLDEGLACIKHDFPVFKEQDLLQKASAEQRENVEAHRRGFTKDFLDTMRSLVHKKAEKKGLEYTVGEMEEFDDFSDELKDVENQIEDDIDSGKYLEEEEEPEAEDEPEDEDEDEDKGEGSDESDDNDSDDTDEDNVLSCDQCGGGFEELEDGVVEDAEGNWFCSDTCKEEYADKE